MTPTIIFLALSYVELRLDAQTYLPSTLSFRHKMQKGILIRKIIPNPTPMMESFVHFHHSRQFAIHLNLTSMMVFPSFIWTWTRRDIWLKATLAHFVFSEQSPFSISSPSQSPLFNASVIK
jgi:hypothetical protein